MPLPLEARGKPGMLTNRLLDIRDFSGRLTKFNVSIAGVSCAIISPDTDFLELLHQRYERFELNGPSEYEIVVQPLSPDTFSRENIGLSSSSPVKRVKSGNSYLINSATQSFLAVANTASKKILVKMLGNQRCFDSFLQTLFALILAEEGSLMLSASVLIENGQASVYFQSPVNGKTSTVRSYRDSDIPAGQTVIIKPHHNQFRVYTPFGDQTADGRINGRAELHVLYALKKDSRHDLVVLERASAVAALFRSVSTFTDDNQLLNRVLDSCYKIIDTVPAYEMHFQQSPFLPALAG